MNPLIEALGERVRFRPSFQDGPQDGLEGTLVAYVDRPQAIVNMDDGTQLHVDATLVFEVQHREWRPIR